MVYRYPTMQRSGFFAVAMTTLMLAVVVDCRRSTLATDICFSDLSNTLNSDSTLCKQTLSSPECACASDPKKMAQFVVGKAISATLLANGSVVEASNVGENGQAIAETCLQNMGSALDNLNNVKSKLSGGPMDQAAVDGIKTSASGAMTDISTCESTFKDDFGVAEPAKLSEPCKTATQYIHVVLLVANKLAA